MATDLHERPRSVTNAVRLAVVALLAEAAVLALARSSAPFIVLVHLSLPALALLAVLQRRRWAAIFFAVAILYDVRTFSLGPSLEWTVIGLRLAALAYLLTSDSRTWFQSPAARCAPKWRTTQRVAIVVILVLQIATILFFVDRLAADRVSGRWQFLWVVFLLPAMMALGCAALFVRGEGRVRAARMIAVALAITSPLVARALTPLAIPFAERRYEAEYQRFLDWSAEKQERQNEESRARNEEAARAQFEAFPVESQEAIIAARARYPEETRQLQITELRKLCDSPQKVKAAGDWYIVLENHHGVRLYGMDRTLDMRRTFEAWAQANLVGRTVDVRIPDGFEDRYTFGWKVEWIRQHGGVMDDRGHQFGEMDGLVFVDGRLINLDYCAAERRERLLQYQDAFARGEF